MISFQQQIKQSFFLNALSLVLPSQQDPSENEFFNNINVGDDGEILENIGAMTGQDKQSFLEELVRIHPLELSKIFARVAELLRQEDSRRCIQRAQHQIKEEELKTGEEAAAARLARINDLSEQTKNFLVGSQDKFGGSGKGVK